jgi:predicted dehydrogenase
MLHVGLYGINGHQVQESLLQRRHPRARLAAVAGFPDQAVEACRALGGEPWVVCPDLDALLARPEIDLIVLCSPRRDLQAADALRCLEAGKHVYAEKPCALSEEEIDCLVATAGRVGRRFHEMAGTAFEQPYFAMRQRVAAGVVGEVVQVLVQKSYPMHAGRPQDEGVDGGLIEQVGVHAVRLIEQVGGVRVADVTAIETRLGNPAPAGGLRIAAALQMRLANGGIASAVANYLNPRAFGLWGNEMLRIFGTAGMMEATDGGTRTRLVLADRDAGPIDVSAPAPDWFSAVVDEILDGTPLPVTLEDELHPTRIVIRAKKAVCAVSPK